MPEILADMDFLARLDLYKKEKAYFFLPGLIDTIDPNDPRLNNLQWERHSKIRVEDIRDRFDLEFDECGFEYRPHKFEIDTFDCEQDVDAYIKETQEWLKERFEAVKVVTYEMNLRNNKPWDSPQYDLDDRLLRQTPAKGAHNDVTYNMGPRIIKSLLSSEEQDKYLQPGFRSRIVNTWRPLTDLPLEDMPLAFCHSASIAPSDLVECDRIYIDRVGEVYYLQHNPDQKWYWLEMQTKNEPFIFLMYDTEAKGARYCPHATFQNVRKSELAGVRFSVETRSVIISKETAEAGN